MRRELFEKVNDNWITEEKQRGNWVRIKKDG